MKKVQRIHIVYGLVALFAFLVLLKVVAHLTGTRGQCKLPIPVEKSRELIDQLDHRTGEFASTTTDLMGQTTEGGVQITYTKNRVRQIVEQRFYKETGRSYARTYYSSGSPFALIVLNTQYAVPLSEDHTGKVGSSEERDYFLAKNGTVCNWFLNDSEQPVDKDVIDMIGQYISAIREESTSGSSIGE